MGGGGGHIAPPGNIGLSNPNNVFTLNIQKVTNVLEFVTQAFERYFSQDRNHKSVSGYFISIHSEVRICYINFTLLIP